MSAPSHIDLFDFIQRVSARVGKQPRKRYRRTKNRTEGALTIAARVVSFTILWKDEIVLSLESDDNGSAMGRTTDLVDAVEVASAWLQGATVPAVRELAPFVDRSLRVLEAFERVVRSAVSAELQYRTEHVRDEQYVLWLERMDRTVIASEIRRAASRLIVHEPRATIEARFMWRGEFVFGLAEAEDRVLLLVERWLSTEAVPSALATEFSWLDLHESAYWHESGHLVEHEFEDSWGRVREYFQSRSDDVPGLVSFIDDLRARGYSERLRVGHEMNTFVASRARRHGLTDGQPWVKFNVFPGEFHVRYELGADRGAEDFSSVEVSPRVLELLELLAAQPIT